MRIRLPLLVFLALTACAPGRESRLIIGSKNFSEQVLLAELVAQQLENRTGLEVEIGRAHV